MCKAKSCKYWKSCLVKRALMDFRCLDYVKNPNYKPKNKKEVSK